MPLHEIPDDVGPNHRYHFGHAIVSFKGEGMRRIQLRLSEPNTFDETLLSIDPKRVNVGQRYVIEGGEVKASVHRSSIGQRGLAIPIGEGVCYLTILGVDLFQQLVCVEVDEERYVMCWEATAAGRRMRANLAHVQEFEAMVSWRHPRDRLSLQRYFAPALEIVAVGVEPPANRPNAHVLAIVENQQNVVIDEPVAALPPVDLNAFVLVHERDAEPMHHEEIDEQVNAGEQIPIVDVDDDEDVVVESVELVNIRDVEAVNNENAVEGGGVDDLNESGENEEWHEPMGEVEAANAPGEDEGAVGGVVVEETDELNAPSESVASDLLSEDRVIRLINEMTARRIAFLDNNAARAFAEHIVRLAMPLSEDAPEAALGDLERLERATRRNQ